MATNFNIAPYYDDFDEKKNFHRILFRPGYAVQARELTQLQTLIQDKVSKFGKHIFTNGTIVLGGGRTFEDDVTSVKFNTTYLINTVDYTLFQDKTIVGQDSETTAIVKLALPVTETDPLTFLVKITSGTGFIPGEVVLTGDEDEYGAQIQADWDPETKGIAFSIDSGVFFVDGNFVYLEPQVISVAKYNNTTSHKIGLAVVESVVTSDQDESLLDNALGTTNYTAPGADRYAIDLQLTSKPIDNVFAGNFVSGQKYEIVELGNTDWVSIGADSNTQGLTFTAFGAGSGTGKAELIIDDFIEIARIVNGKLVNNKDRTIYSEIGKELARRTFDESGDYTVRRWPIQLLDRGSLWIDWTATTEVTTDNIILSNGNYYQVTIEGTTGSTAPVHTSGIATNGTATLQWITPKFQVALDPGKGYIKGYEFESLNQVYLNLDRARDTESVEEIALSVNYGNYVLVNLVKGAFVTNSDSGAYSEVTLHDECFADFADQAALTAAKVGTAQVRFMSHVAGVPGTSPNTVYRMYLFNIQMDAGKYFKDVESIFINDDVNPPAEQTYANIDGLSMIGGSGDTFLSSNDVSGLVFQTPNQYIKTIRLDNDYVYQKTFTANVVDGIFELNSGDSNLTFYPNTGTISDDDVYTNYHVVLTSISSGGSGLDEGQPLDYAGGSVTTSLAATKATFTYTDLTLNGTVTVIATFQARHQGPRSKDLSNYRYKIISNPNVTVSGKDSLGISDLYDVLAIYNTANTNPTTQLGTLGKFNTSTGAITWDAVPNTLVTSNYIIDDGQRADVYDHANLILAGTAPASTNYLVVVFRNFSHTGNNYLSVDSYTSSGIEYGDIPTFVDPASGKTYELRDCIDFRPVRDENTTTVSNAQVPDPRYTFTLDYEYYLARFDKVIATADKYFTVKKGIPALLPRIPTDESNGMTLYVLSIPPYTSDVRDIQIKYIDNKRYTMRDIGRLEKRISNLEYYTQLSLLEKQAKDSSFPDSSNIEKFKNGFAVDPFTSQDIFIANASVWSQRRWNWWDAWFNGSTAWTPAAQTYNENSIAKADDPDFHSAVDPVNAELRAQFLPNFYEFDVNAEEFVDTQKTGDLVTLAYVEKSAINQPQATTYMNVNPFNVIYFFGSVLLEKAFDLWVDTVKLPDVNHIIDVRIPDARDVTIVNGPVRNLPFIVTSSTTTIQTNVLSENTVNIGSSVVDLQFIPFIRANTIFGIGKGFKPKDKLYVFIENTNVTQFARPLTKITVQNHVGTLFDDTQGTYEEIEFRGGSHIGPKQGSGKAVIYTQPTGADATKRTLFVNDVTGTLTVGQHVFGNKGNGHAVITAITTYPLPSDLIPDETGYIAFELQIPPATFRTGERTVRLINSSVNDTQTADSLGEAKYTAIGTLQTIQGELLTTRTVQNQRITVQNRTYYDPLAQTFLVDSLGYPQGFHVSSVDLYFASKSQTIPVVVEIRKTVNGYPESVRTIPFAEVILQPEKVNVPVDKDNSDGSIATNFKFANPIHLVPGEYSIVVLANTQDYELYVAEVGGKLLLKDTRVSQQPYTGSLFKSQNASTWEPDQNKDMKFNIYRAEFEPIGTVQFDIEDPDGELSYQTLYANSATVLPTGTSIRWEAKALTSTDPNSASWTPININQNTDFDILRKLNPAIDILDGKASLQLKATLITEDTAVSPAVDVAVLSAVTALNVINNDSKYEATTVVNDGSLIVGKKYTITTVGTSNFTTIGAATNTLGTIFVATGTGTTPAVGTGSVTHYATSGGNALARYITKPINLADGFDATNLNVTVDVNKPSGTDVKVYFRTLPTEKISAIADEAWVEMVLETPVANTTGYFEFKEHRYFPVGSFDQYGIPQDSPVTQRFNAFQVKIVLLSTSEVRTPRLRDLRIIALDS